MKPSKLYKYQQITPRNIQNITDELIWIPKPESFNDPFDCNNKLHGKNKYFESVLHYKDTLDIKGNEAVFQPLITFLDSEKLTEKERIKHVEEILSLEGNDESIKTKFDRYEKKIYKMRSTIGVLSLSETRDNILMWSHYANNHTGICLEFSKEEPHHNNENSLNEKKLTKPIEYVEAYLSIAEMKVFDATPEDMTKHLFHLKAKDWEYEQEWRTLTEGGGKTFKYPGKLTGIIFGAMADKDEIDTVILATSKHIEKPAFYNAVMKTDQFALEIKKL